MKVVIFDGVCNLCNSSVDFLIRRDKKAQLKFTANQHQTGQQILQEAGVTDVETLYFYEDGTLYDRSTAVLRLSRYLPFPWNVGQIFLIVPRFLRDGVYRWIARNRYSWFGKKDSCRLPSPAESARFLD
ncbi:MAG: thiol-disulfide oxidoreductase DCC family protein [Bacteroidota bacterium]